MTVWQAHIAKARFSELLQKAASEGPQVITRYGVQIAVVVSAAAFTAYHPLRDATGAFSMPRVTFYLLAGLYFGAVYVVRGFGIVVGVHAFYDIMVVSMLPGPDPAS